ncbi:hypothetical protein SAMN05443270_3076 [Lacrimispora sphenoides]|nr:hypothetical protein SAMN05443270_3076 [Lacrimispora sphenoides]
MCKDCYFVDKGEDGRFLCTCESSEKLYKYVSDIFVCDEYVTKIAHDYRTMNPFEFASKYYG